MAEIPVNLLDKDLPHNVGNPVKDIFSPPHRPVVPSPNDNVTLRPASKIPGWPRGPRES
jgi:hypothetical protein